jgi:SAM-dependent methyltransferase
MLSSSRMLDIGIGGGRTTAHFAPLVFEYVGIDSAEPMIQACRKRFTESMDNGHFEVCDARSMTRFRNATFDFILFSYNGLDYMNHDDRLRALTEIRRVAKRGARFLFSAHNLDSLRRRRLWKLWRRNAPSNEVLARDWAIVNDGALFFGLSTYYIRPEAQIAQLNTAGFGDVEVLEGNGSWIYYLCTAV